jgi:hypothetical protein
MNVTGKERTITYYPSQGTTGSRIFKLLWSPRIDSKDSVPQPYVAWRAVWTTLFLAGSHAVPIDWL